jgi:hypothetical protein
MSEPPSEKFLWLTQTDWTGIAAIAQSLAAIAAAGALVVAAYQIREIRREAKKGRTLAACEQYDLDPVLTQAVRTLYEARIAGDLDKNPKAFSPEMHTVINYLDQLAIGSQRDAYTESVLYDYMFFIFDGHYRDLIESTVAPRADWLPEHYEAFATLCLEWRRKHAKAAREVTT